MYTKMKCIHTTDTYGIELYLIIMPYTNFPNLTNYFIPMRYIIILLYDIVMCCKPFFIIKAILHHTYSMFSIVIYLVDRHSLHQYRHTLVILPNSFLYLASKCKFMLHIKRNVQLPRNYNVENTRHCKS